VTELEVCEGCLDVINSGIEMALHDV
jgi:hypothetical protein